jgi:hypothetical protein
VGLALFLFAVLSVLNLFGLRNGMYLLCDAAAFPRAEQLFAFGIYVATYVGASIVAPALLIAAALLTAAAWLGQAW